nr:hypothetical protein CFP56_77529 [Quercus suber]
MALANRVSGCDRDPREGCAAVTAGGAYLEHLDKGDGKIEVSEVTADEGQGEHDADGNDGAKVDAARHGHVLARVEHGGEARHELGHDGGEQQMPCGEEDGCDSGQRDGFAQERGQDAPGEVCNVRKWKPAVLRIHLLKRMTLEEREIQVLRGRRGWCAALGGSGFSEAGLTVGRVSGCSVLGERSCSPDCRSFSFIVAAGRTCVYMWDGRRGRVWRDDHSATEGTAADSLSSRHVLALPRFVSIRFLLLFFSLLLCLWTRQIGGPTAVDRAGARMERILMRQDRGPIEWPSRL